MNEKEISTREWWESKRGAYNKMLVIVGILAFVFFATASWTLVEDAEITLFTIFVQGIGYLIAIGLANICFFLGPILEWIIKPSEKDRFRKLTYKAGYWLSASLPMTLPILVVLNELFWK